MHAQREANQFLLGGIIVVFGVALAWCAEPQSNEADKSKQKEAAVAPVDQEQRVPVAVARDRAKLMHKVYSSTLDVMHQYYFHESKAVLPARAMEDVFADIAQQSNIKARWISVNTRPMSIQHEPRTEFEKKAATELASGKEEYERIEDGYYQRAGVIPLSSGCVSCHNGFFTAPPKTPRYAGLVISVPVHEK